MTASTDHPTTRGTSNSDLLGRLDRIEDLLTRRLDRQDTKLDSVSSRLDKMEGGLGMLKWLGPTGIVAVIFAIAQASGLIR
jgi:hypothetical protein